MQGFKSRSVSSDMQQRNSLNFPSPKRSPSPKVTRGSSSSSDSIDSRASRGSERKPSHIPPSLHEKQKTMRISEMQQQLGKVLEDMKRAKEERSQALEELAEMRKRNEGSAQSHERIMMLQAEVDMAKESEMKLLESLISQTKQLEQTKILLEETKLEMRSLREGPVTSEKKGLLASVQIIQAQEEIRILRNELRLALQAEEESKKAMDDFVIALKEVTTELTRTKEDLFTKNSKLEKVKEEALHSKSMLDKIEQELREAVEAYGKLKLEHEDSAASWKEKEDSFLECIKFSEEDMEKKDEENSVLADAHKVAKEETSKLRDIIKQAVNEAMMVKQSLDIARKENYELKEQLSEKESALEKMACEHESIKACETAALDSLRELKGLLGSSSNKDSNFLEAEPLGQSIASYNDRMISKNMKMFSSFRWESPQVQNENRRSFEESDFLKSVALDNRRALEGHDRDLSSDAFDHFDRVLYHTAGNDKQKKKKTVLGRFGDALRRRSFRKS